MTEVLPFERPKPKKDALLTRLETDKAFWYGQLKQASAEYMSVCWKLALYKQGKDHESKE